MKNTRFLGVPRRYLLRIIFSKIFTDFKITTFDICCQRKKNHFEFEIFVRKPL